MVGFSTFGDGAGGLDQSLDNDKKSMAFPGRKPSPGMEGEAHALHSGDPGVNTKLLIIREAGFSQF